MKKQIRFITECAIFTAIGLVLDLIAHFFLHFSFLNGGSISIAMVPIFIMGYRWNLRGGLFCGLLIGILQLTFSDSFIHPIQVLLDYVAAYAVVGFGSPLLYKASKSKKIFIKQIFIFIGIFIGISLRLLSATISGYLYWETALIPSFIYNLTYLLPSFILSFIVTIILTNLVPKLKNLQE